MTFKPSPFTNAKLEDKVAYYRLFGRVAAGSNVKVRLTDKHLPGLGVAVATRGEDTRLKVEGLQASESYVFAVAAYSQSGEVVGGSIGATGRPIVACFPLSMLMLWGYCCQVICISAVHRAQNFFQCYFKCPFTCCLPCTFTFVHIHTIVHIHDDINYPTGR